MSENFAGTSEGRLRRALSISLWGVPGCPFLGAILIGAAAWFWGAGEVRGNIGMVTFLVITGIVWMVLAGFAFSWLGISVRDDAWERKNPAASATLGCAFLAVSMAVAAGNLGEGPSLWENVFSAAVALIDFFGLWTAFEMAVQISRSVAEDRDVASGLRFGGLLLAWGLILGRAVTGNWHSCGTTVVDAFRDGWPAIIMWLLALPVELWLRPGRLRPFPSWFTCGLVPAAIYLEAAIAWVWHLGRWEGMPQ